jgi:PleD family two-component response regulator
LSEKKQMNKTESNLEVVGTVEPIPKLIMIIDQTEEILDLFRQILSEEGYEVSLHYHSQQSL